MSKAALVIMARYPEPGKTKTRLARTIGSDRSATLYQAFLTDLAHRFVDQPYHLHWAYTPPDANFHDFIATLTPSYAQYMTCFPQQGIDLGARLHHAFKETHKRGFERTILISSDSPHINLTTITDAYKALDRADVVLGPAEDGGYYLIAMHHPHDVFTSIPMSTSRVCQMTMNLAYRQELLVHLLHPLLDIDELPDLLRLADLLQENPDLAPATAAHLRKEPNQKADILQKSVILSEAKNDNLGRRDTMPSTTLVSTLPRSIYIEPTSRCNEFCQQCPRTLLAREEDRDLTFDNFRYIVDQFPILDRVVLHGLGEPLLNKDLPQMVRYLKARGTYVLFNSNGIALTPKRGQALIDAGLDEYRLSMDGSTREMYAHVRGVDAFDKIWRNIRAFIALQKEQNATKPVVSLWFTAMKENLHELPRLIDLATEHGIREVHLQRLVYFEQGLAESKQALFRRSTPEELALVHRCEQTCKERGITFSAAGATTPLESLVRDFGDRPWLGCRRPYTLTYITSSGNVLSCCFAPFGHKSAQEYREERVLGNIFQEPIQSIWTGPRYQAFRRAFESDHPARHCSQCGLNWSY